MTAADMLVRIYVGNLEPKQQTLPVDIDIDY